MPRPTGRADYITHRERHNIAQGLRAMALKLNRLVGTGAAVQLGVEAAVKNAEREIRHAVYTVERGKSVI